MRAGSAAWLTRPLSSSGDPCLAWVCRSPMCTHAKYGGYVLSTMYGSWNIIVPTHPMQEQVICVHFTHRYPLNETSHVNMNYLP